MLLQDNVVLPKGFTEYIYHVGNASELNSIIGNGLILGGKSLKRRRQAVFFTTVNPMEYENGMAETARDLTKPRIAPYKNTWKRFQHAVFWSILKLAQEKVLQFYQTRSHAVVLYDTLPAASIEKVVCMRTQDELYQKGSLNSKITMSCTQIELAMWCTRSTRPRSKIILKPHQAIRRVTVKPGTASWTTEFLAYHFQQWNSRMQGV